ncbi:unnamed protein product [Rotaria sp. Silwood2]|nr:unnamed protein product [Rotaria sp. Silwood2]
MASTTIPLRNDNDGFDSRKQFKERPVSTESSEKLLSWNRSRATPTTNQQGQWYTTAGHKQTNNSNYDVDLLKHLSTDFADLLNRTDISDYTFIAVHRCVLAARSNAFSAVLSGNNSQVDPKKTQGLETSIKNGKLVISISNTDPEIMKQVIIFMYTAQCELNERNGTNAFNLFFHRY